MTILINHNTRAVIQGITGTVGSFQAKIMKEYGTQIVAGVTPRKGSAQDYDIPVYDFVAEAVAEHSPNTAFCFVPAKFARDAAIEVIQSRLELLVITTEGVPEKDMLEIVS